MRAKSNLSHRKVVGSRMRQLGKLDIRQASFTQCERWMC